MHPLERLLNLVALLLETRRPLSFAEIREKLHEAYGQEDVDAAKRMFERDKDVLRDIGIPVEVVPTDSWGTEDGYLVPKEGYYLPEIAFTPQELSALLVAAHAAGEDGEAERAARKLVAGVGGSVLAGLSERPMVAGPDVPASRLLAVTEAMDRGRSIRFEYRPVSGQPARRQVDPYALVWQAGHWYVVGLDRNRDAVRSFRMSRFLSEVEEGEEGSSRPEGFDAREHLLHGPWGLGRPEAEARVAFSPDVEWWATEGLPSARRLKTRKDGWVEVALPASRSDSFVSWVLSFGSDAVLLAPRDLRREVVARLEAVLAAG